MSISLVALVFFDQSPRWIRYQESRGHLNEVGKRSPSGDRLYTLLDVKMMARSLFHYGSIDQEGFGNCMARIESIEKPVFKRSKDR